jgi:hypothetical protein
VLAVCRLIGAFQREKTLRRLRTVRECQHR